ncbi:unnamed protein product [Xylocopa violacea]|uniref:MAGE domain-containing protein n=1 Tax=Xylocopa violacea TaxID=135666 RepID=A0ABP1P8A1_XYLVO
MSSSQNCRTIPRQKSLSQSTDKGQNTSINSLSLSHPSTSASILEQTSYVNSQNCSDLMNTSEEERQLVNRTVRYLLTSDRSKQVISKTRIIKNVLDSRGKQFLCVMNKAKSLLSKIFGYQLVELENNKYILVNEIENTLPHIHPIAIEVRQRVLLFIVLVHIFMHQQSCTEDSLWDFLTNLGISCSDNHCHAYFGHVKQLITQVFVAQKYLDKIVVEKNNSTEIEFKWGSRAEHEFSRRTALEFISRVYHGRPINSWPLQYNALTAHKLN